MINFRWLKIAEEEKCVLNLNQTLKCKLKTSICVHRKGSTHENAMKM